MVTSKRKLKQLVDEGGTSRLGRPRMPTIVGLRRRGYTPEAIREFVRRVGVSKADYVVDGLSWRTRAGGPEPALRARWRCWIR